MTDRGLLGHVQDGLVHEADRAVVLVFDGRHHRVLLLVLVLIVIAALLYRGEHVNAVATSYNHLIEIHLVSTKTFQHTVTFILFKVMLFQGACIVEVLLFSRGM
jgi:hypothetical protein